MVTYFIRVGDFVKIGKTSNIKTRLSAIQTAQARPVELIKVSTISESEAHTTAATLTSRANGEWFKANARLIEWIKSLPDDLLHSGKTNILKLRPSQFLSHIEKFTFAEKLEAFRNRLHMTQLEASAFLEVSPRTYWLWESGGNVPAITQEGALARFRNRAKP